MTYARTLVVLVTAAVAAAAAGPAAASTSTPTAKLLTTAVARSAPDAQARTLQRIAPRRPYSQVPTVLPVLETRTNDDGSTWLQVRLPQRPNGATGWISVDGTQPGRTSWEILLNRATRTATITRGGKTVKRFRIVIGKRSTPTPAGSFFVTEAIRQPQGAAIGPWALATNAYSDVLQEFAGGPGQIALHGMTGFRDPLGSATSHGCIRLSDTAISWLAARIQAGTPLTIR